MIRREVPSGNRAIRAEPVARAGSQPGLARRPAGDDSPVMREPERDPEGFDERVRQEPVSVPEPEGHDDPHPGRDAVERLQQTAGNSAVSQAVAPAAQGAARRVAEGLVPGLGRPLEPRVRRDMEAHLGRDLRGVRIHTGSAAARVARGIGARAYAAGNDIVFAEGAYAPDTPTGRETLAHELTHVVQQRGEARAAPSGRGARAAEDDARRSGRAAAGGEPAPARPREAVPALVQGDAEEATTREWEKIGDIFDAEDETPGPVVLAEGLGTTSARVHTALEEAGALTDDSGEQGRMRRVGEELERAQPEIPDVVADVDTKRLPEIRESLEEMDESLEKVEQIGSPAEQRTRAVSELTRVTKAAGKLEAALPSGTWRTRLKGLADLGPLVARLIEEPAPAGGADGEGEGDGDGSEVAKK